MSRSGYNYDCDDNWAAIMWRGRVASSVRGKRGQAFLHELVEALDAMPEKRLIANDLRRDGEVCALGCIGEIGHFHKLAGDYLGRYAAEMGWRDDHRRLSNGDQFRAVVGLVAKNKPSVDFCGYWQRALAVDPAEG